MSKRLQEALYAASAEARQLIRDRGRTLAIALTRGKSLAPALPAAVDRNDLARLMGLPIDRPVPTMKPPPERARQTL